MFRAAATLAFCAALAGCAADAGNAPSLLPRAAEQQTFDEPTPAAAPAVAPDPALDRQIAELTVRRGAAAKDFADSDRRVAALSAAGARAAVGSSAWLDAQTALSELDTGRAAMLDVLTDLDALAAARNDAGDPPYPALDTARAATEAEVARITALVAKRKAALPL